MKMVQNDINTSVNAVEMHVAIPAKINTEVWWGNLFFCVPIQSHEITQA